MSSHLIKIEDGFGELFITSKAQEKALNDLINTRFRYGIRSSRITPVNLNFQKYLTEHPFEVMVTANMVVDITENPDFNTKFISENNVHLDFIADRTVYHVFVWAKNKIMAQITAKIRLEELYDLKNIQDLI